MRNIVLTMMAVGAALAVASTAAAQPVSAGLVAYLPFNNNVSDISGQNNNGTIIRPFNGSVSDPGNYTPGVSTGLGQAFRTRGTNSGTPNVANNNYVTFSNGTPNALNGLSLSNPNASFSAAFWVRYSAANLNADPSYFSNKNWDAGANNGFVYSANGTSNWKWNYRTDADARRDFNAASVVNNDAWHHIAITLDRSVTDGLGSAYFDGVQLNQTALGIPGSLATAGLATNIFQDGTGNYTDGTTQAIWLDAAMDDFGLWNRVLSPIEVNRIFTAGLAGIPLNLVAVPEPGSLALCGLAVAGLAGPAWRRWRRRQ